MTTQTFLAGVQSILLAGAVLLSSVHAKDIVKPRPAAGVKAHAIVKVHADDGGLSKVSSELHNHVDKQTLKTLYHSNSIQHRAERRSLEVLERNARALKTELKFGFSVWWRLAAAKLML